MVDPDRARAADAVGARFLFDPDGAVRRRLAGARLAEGSPSGSCRLSDRPRAGASGRASRCLPTLPRVRLVIVGAGHVGQAVAALAAQADFDVWVVDDRHQYANAERFPDAPSGSSSGPIDEVLPALDVTPQTYALIVTRGHGHDQEALYHLAPTPAPYVGLIGSRRKIRLIFESLREHGDRPRRPGAGRGPGRVRHRLADGPRDRHQHRRRADRPAQPGPGRPGARRRRSTSDAADAAAGRGRLE